MDRSNLPAQTAPSPEVIQAWEAAVRRALAYIDDHLSTPLSVNAVARYAGVSESHFRMLFASLVGESPGNYVRRRRLERAALALKLTSDSITSIAIEMGFDSPAAFSRSFRRHFDCSPRAFRKTRMMPQVNGDHPTLNAPRNRDCGLDVHVAEHPAWHFAYVSQIGFGLSDLVWNGVRVLKWAQREKSIPEESRLRFAIRTFDDDDITALDQERMDVGLVLSQAPSGETATEVSYARIPAQLGASAPFAGTFDDHAIAWQRFAYDWCFANGYDYSELAAFDFLDMDRSVLRNAAVLAAAVVKRDYRYHSEMRIHIKPGRPTIFRQGSESL